MAFFGITALGSQSCFAAEYKHRYNVSIFDDDDALAAFQASARKHSSGTIPVEEVSTVLTELFHGPAPDFEVARFRECIEARGLRELSVDAWMDVFHALQEEEPEKALEEDRSKAAHFNSSGLLLEQRARHTRAELPPTRMFQRPLTGAQEVGWRASEPVLDATRHPKKHCEETKFMASLHASGYL